MNMSVMVFLAERKWYKFMMRIPSAADHDSEVPPISSPVIGEAVRCAFGEAKQGQENKQEKTRTTQISSSPESDRFRIGMVIDDSSES